MPTKGKRYFSAPFSTNCQLSHAYQLDDTICALSTPAGTGAIAVIRASGKDALRISDRIFVSGQKKLSEQASHTAHFGRLVDEEEVLDEVVATIFKNPRSFTGEDVVEFSCHGSTLIQRKILELLAKSGCRMAQPGEFTLRAYLNQKMDLSQAEAVADLIASSSDAAHKVALGQMRGGFSDDLKVLREKLIEFAALIELELDFSGEDVEFVDRTELVDLIDKIQERIIQLIGSFKLGNVIKEGVQVAIIGPPNAGKSTLLNAILNEERAIVSDIAGTTRDTVEDETMIDGIRFRFIDTAGIRESTDRIESLGIERSIEKSQRADIVVYLYDMSDEHVNESIARLGRLKEADPELEQKLLVVGNKVDNAQDQSTDQNTFKISAKNREGVEDMKKALVDKVNTEALQNNETIVTNVRHVGALSSASESLKAASEGFESGTPSDLVAIDIRKALFHLGEITGEVSTDDLLGNIFGKFCIGK